MTTAPLTEILRDAITLSQAAQLFSPVPHVATVWRWTTKGTRGVTLASWIRGGQRVTTRAAIEQFLRSLNTSEDAVPSADESSRRAAAENAALKAILH